MEKNYKVVFVYPDGHLEEIQDLFKTGREALDYGNNLLAQVNSTEKFLHRSSFDEDDIFGNKEPIDPYFMIIEFGDNKKYSLVYDSRR